LEPLPHADANRRATTRLVRYIEQQSLRRTFASLAEDVGADEKSVRNIFRGQVRELERTARIETPKWMGLDEIHIMHRPRAVVTNIHARLLLNIFPNRLKRSRNLDDAEWRRKPRNATLIGVAA
jgi:transposase